METFHQLPNNQSGQILSEYLLSEKCYNFIGSSKVPFQNNSADNWMSFLGCQPESYLKPTSPSHAWSPLKYATRSSPEDEGTPEQGVSPYQTPVKKNFIPAGPTRISSPNFSQGKVYEGRNEQGVSAYQTPVKNNFIPAGPAGISSPNFSQGKVYEGRSEQGHYQTPVKNNFIPTRWTGISSPDFSQGKVYEGRIEQGVGHYQTPVNNNFIPAESTRISSPNPPVGQICNFCRRNGDLRDFYTGHQLRDEEGRVRCPILRTHHCEVCGATGDYAHTRSYCPTLIASGRKPRKNAASLKETKYDSAGRTRKFPPF